MDSKQLGVLKEHGYRIDKLIWDKGLMRRNGSGHTREVADLEVVHDGRDSASAYLFGRLTGTIGSKKGIEILKAISELQVTDINAERYGAFQWYREESGPIDTNAAFFIMIPLTILRLISPENITADEISQIDLMIDKAYNWFSRECENPILYYTNKIISDGAMLTAIGSITGNEKYIKQARKFLYKWLDYTETRGYGWGENMSPGYNGVTLQAFGVILKALGDNLGDNKIRERFLKLEQGILDTFKFHDGHEFVPAIRSYNIAGSTNSTSYAYNLAGVGGFGIKEFFGRKTEPDDVFIFNMAKTLLVFGERLYFSRPKCNDFSTRKKITRIMDDKSAYSWLCKSGGLGSVNEFPIIKGSYQHKGWGLGWQCFPVSFIVYDEGVSFLRFNVDSGDRIRNHPHKYKHRDFLDPSLFKEAYYPKVRTKCHQNSNTLIAIRDMCALRNFAGNISDSLDIQHFTGEVYEMAVNGRQWIAVSYEKACILITPLQGISEGHKDYIKMHIEIENKENDLRLIQNLYTGDYQTLFDDRLSTGWVIHFIDRGLEKDEIVRYIDRITVEENCSPDGEIPRMPVWNVHNVIIKVDEEMIIDYSFDPYE